MSKWREEIKVYADIGIARDLWFHKILDEYEEKIEQMEKQIEMMKNCHNCKGFSEYRCSECKNYDKWEAKE